MAKRDENRDIRSVSRIAKVNSADRSIQAPKTAIIGIHMCGKIDYLTHYCGYHFYWNNSASPTNISNKTSTSARAEKKKAKEQQHNNKLNKKKK